MNVLVPIDGSPSSVRAVQYVVESTAWLNQSPQVFLLNVQWKLASGNVKFFISPDSINEYYREQGLLALAPARDMLDKSKIAYNYHISVGIPAEAIVLYAQENQIDQIVMGAHGQDTLSALLLGSVVSKVMHLCSLPVVLIK
jgi:nucleotide-binding universal stress UspA family protein